MFSSISNQENNSKINQEIEQVAKSLVSGLNLAQVSVSSSVLGSIIDACIQMKNEGFAECKNTTEETFVINVTKTEGNVKISDLSINQLTDGLLSCVLNSANKNLLKNETDLKISQISSAKAEGLDMKWIALAAAIGLGGTGIAGTSALKTLIGPGLAVAGCVFSYVGYKSINSSDLKNTVLWIKNPLSETTNIGTLNKILEEPNTLNDKAVNHGEADIYESFGGTITLYKGGDVQKIINHESELTKKDLKIDIANNKLTLSVNNSKKYKSKTFEFPDNITDYKFKTEVTEEVSKTTVLIDDTNFIYSHHLPLYYNKKIIDDYIFEPTVISYHDLNNSQTSNLFKNPVFLIGIALLCIGILLILINAFKKNN